MNNAREKKIKMSMNQSFQLKVCELKNTQQSYQLYWHFIFIYNYMIQLFLFYSFLKTNKRFNAYDVHDN